MAEERRLERQQELAREKTAAASAGRSEDGKRCPGCGAALRPGGEFCPHCGASLVPYCTFCGADIPAGEDECPECGMSRKGVICPRCGTLNVRAYCRKCNEPLTPAARKELERAKKDPVFLKAAELAVKLAELEQELQGTDGEDAADDARELPPDILRLKELLASASSGKAAGAAPAPKPKAAPAKPAGKRKSREELQAEYARMKAELNATLRSMVPPAGSTPQEQRNYYSARKVTVVQKVRGSTPIAWVCNYCGCRHSQPSECVEPQLGGTYIYDEKFTEVTKEL